MYSVTAILFDLGLPGFDTLMHNSRDKSQIINSMNYIITYLNVLGHAYCLIVIVL